MADGVFYLAVGVSMVIWRKRLVRGITAWYTRFEGLRLMTEREAKRAERLMLAVGTVLVVLGIVGFLPTALVLLAQLD